MQDEGDDGVFGVLRAASHDAVDLVKIKGTVNTKAIYVSVDIWVGLYLSASRAMRVQGKATLSLSLSRAT